MPCRRVQGRSLNDKLRHVGCGFVVFFYKDCGLKKIYSRLKLRVLFYWVGIFRTSSPGDSISSDPEKTVPGMWMTRELWGEVGKGGQRWGGVRLYRNICL